MILFFAAVGCCAVGLMIGWCGVAGFLLPILFVSVCGLSVVESLFFSFFCFALSGAIGAFNYYRRGELSIGPSLWLCAGSLLGSLAGAVLGTLVPATIVKKILYVVVLLSGVAIILGEIHPKEDSEHKVISRKWLMPLGLFSALICAISGAGGPVLVMPLLVVFGFPVKVAVGMALLDSVFIAIPAVLVYGSQCKLKPLLVLFLASILSHSIGVAIGSKTATRVPQCLLKRGVALFSIFFALLMLFK